MYRYTLTSCASSAQYGNCDVCHEPAADVYSQTEERYYAFTCRGKFHAGWTPHHCSRLFGHKACLVSQQKHDVCVDA